MTRRFLTSIVASAAILGAWPAAAQDSSAPAETPTEQASPAAESTPSETSTTEAAATEAPAEATEAESADTAEVTEAEPAETAEATAEPAETAPEVTEEAVAPEVDESASTGAEPAEVPMESAAPAVKKKLRMTDPEPVSYGPWTYSVRDRFWAESLTVQDWENDDTEALDGVFHKLAMDIEGDFKTLRFKVAAEFLRGEISGATYVSPPDERGVTGTSAYESPTETRNIVDPFEGYVAYRPGVAEVRVGLQRSNFGLGMLANGGEEGRWSLFNQAYGADRGLRALVATRPAAIFSKGRIAKRVTVALGADIVYRDDNASLLDGDMAYQFLGSVFYADTDPSNPDNETFLGAYFAYRDQTDRDIEGIDGNDTLQAAAVDISGRKSWTMDDFWFKVAGEAALLSGSSTRAYTQSLEDNVKLLGLGAAADLQATYQPALTSLRVLTGYASGDANSDDDTLYRFRFDPNYKVGLVLYDYYLPSVTRYAYLNASDDEQSGEPPKGLFGLVNDGQVQNTIFLNPQFLFGDPDGLLTGVGALWAWSAAPLQDPYNTFSNGGSPVGPRGGEATQNLGVEIDVAAQYRYTVWKRFTLEAKAEFGILFPGSAFHDEFGQAPPPSNLVRGRLGLNW